jgi:hypothetical protein
MRDVLYNTMHRTAEQLLVLIVHSHHNEKLRSTRRTVQQLAEVEFRYLEVIRIARSGRVPYVRKLALVAQGAHIQQFRGYREVEHEVTVEESMHCKEERKYG